MHWSFRKDIEFDLLCKNVIDDLRELINSAEELKFEEDSDFGQNYLNEVIALAIALKNKLD